MRRLFAVVCAVACLLVWGAVNAQAATKTEEVLETLSNISRYSVSGWRYQPGDAENGADPALDDSSWKTGDPEFEWGSEPNAWLRVKIVVPKEMAGVPVEGSRLRFTCGVDDDGIIYVNGREVQRFHWGQGNVTLTENARPGEVIHVAIKGINTGGPGRLLFARLHCSKVDEIESMAASYVRRWRFAQELLEMAPKDDRAPYLAWLDESAAAVNLEALKTADFDLFRASIDKALEVLSPIDEITRDMCIYMVGHAHIDMNWLWLWPETIDVCKNTFSTMCSLMEEYPLTFSQSQAAVYYAMQQHHPEVFEKIKQAIKSGRWEPVVSTWTEGDNNMSCGEAIVRSILYGKRYMKQQFGTESVVGWFPDNFGHPRTLPQIMAKSGIKYYYFARCGNGYPVFWWEAPDGSRVLAYNYGHYNHNVDFNLPMNVVRFAARTGLEDYMHVYGVGDHGGGPTREMLDTAKQLAAELPSPKIKYTGAREYFDEILRKKQDYPVWSLELNPIFEGCYTTHGDIKRWNRESENLLPTAEKFCSIAANWGFAYPAGAFVNSWRNTCFNQFHDLLCGSAIHGSYDHSRELYEQAVEQAKQALEKSLELIAGQINTKGPGIPIVVFNSCNWRRTDVVDVPSPFAGEKTAVKISDADGNVYLARSMGDRLQFTARDVPSLGYKVFWVNRAQKPLAGSVKASDNVIENQYFRVSIDPLRGVIDSVYDKTNKKELMPKNASGALLQILLEKPHGMSAWNIGEISGQQDLIDPGEIVVLDNGPARATISFDHNYNSSQIVQEVTLHDDVPRIDIRITADWQEKGGPDKDSPMLKWAFPTQIMSSEAVFEVPFGWDERPTNGNEMCAINWIDLPGEGYGISLLNNCKHGFDLEDGVIRATLLRSAYEPDPIPDVGMHEILLSLYPHAGDWRQAGTVRRGVELNQPLIARVVKPQQGEFPVSRSFLSIDAPNIVVTALKRAEDGGAFILRFYETDGKPCTTTITFGLPIKNVVETDLMENEIGPKTPVESGRLSVNVGKHEIKTYKLFIK